MPVYEYKCERENCGEITERVREIEDRHKRVKCGSCGSTSPKLIISKTDFTLIGGGWATDGYAGGGKKDKK